MGFAVFDVNDPTDSVPGNTQDFQFVVREWDSTFGWTNLNLAAFNGFDSWNNLRIESTGTSYDYYLNNTYLYSDFTVSAPQFADLQRIYIQGYNFGLGGYDILWDNLSVIPAPGVPSLALIGLFAAIRRRRA